MQDLRCIIWIFLMCTGPFSCGVRVLELVGSVAVVHRLSCSKIPKACGIFYSLIRNNVHIPCISGWILNLSDHQ